MHWQLWPFVYRIKPFAFQYLTQRCASLPLRVLTVEETSTKAGVSKAISADRAAKS